MLDRTSYTTELQDKITHFSKPVKEQYYNYLISNFGVLFTFHSNRIEGTNMTLTLNDTKEILNQTYPFNSIIDSNKKREVNETINHQKAFQFIFQILNDQIDIVTLTRQLHQLIGSGIIEGAGKNI